MKKAITTLKYILEHPLNKSRRMAALLRFIRWQIGSTFLNHPVCLPYIDNTVLITQKGMTSATANYYGGLSELAEMGFLLHFLRDNDHFVDIGANVGAYTVLAAGVSKARVTACEPVPATASSLMRNITANNLTELVRVKMAAVSSTTTTLSITTESGQQNHVARDTDTKKTVFCCATTVDTICQEAPATVIKIDVEGYELEVLKGAKKTFESPCPPLAVLIETNGSGTRYGHSDTAIFSQMASWGFTPYDYDPFSRQLTSYTASGGNTLFISQLDPVKQRLETASKHQLINGSI